MKKQTNKKKKERKKSSTVLLTSCLVLKLAGNLAVPNAKREDVWVCSGHQYPGVCGGGVGRWPYPEWGRTCSCLTSYLRSDLNGTSSSVLQTGLQLLLMGKDQTRAFVQFK